MFKLIPATALAIGVLMGSAQAMPASPSSMPVDGVNAQGAVQMVQSYSYRYGGYGNYGYRSRGYSTYGYSRYRPSYGGYRYGGYRYGRY